MPNLAERIRQARRSAYPRLQQRDLAEKLKVNRSAVGQWETGASKPGLDRIERIAKICKVDVRWLLTGEGRPNPSLDAAEEKLKRVVRDKAAKIEQERLIKIETDLEELKRARGAFSAAGAKRAALELKVYGKVAANFQPAYAAPLETLHLAEIFDPAKRYGLVVSGQSMSPTAVEGDICLVEPVQWELPEYDEERGPADKKFWKALHGEIVCASLNGDDAILKRMHISDRKDTGFKISLVSDNPANSMIEVTRNDRLRIVGLVRHILRSPRAR
jgi:SOS-response transcriptional repressor LexA